MTEMWKPIPGYEGLYEASNLGRIRSLDRKVTDKSGKRSRLFKGKILVPQLHSNYNKKKYLVALCKNGVQKEHILARLIAMAWVDGYEEGLTVDHIDGNCLNNRADNLEWVSWQENLTRGYNNGLMKQVPVVLEDEHGNRYSFTSRREASRFLNKHPQYMNSVVTQGIKFATATDGTKYKIIKGREKYHA